MVPCTPLLENNDATPSTIFYTANWRPLRRRRCACARRTIQRLNYPGVAARLVALRRGVGPLSLLAWRGSGRRRRARSSSQQPARPAHGWPWRDAPTGASAGRALARCPPGARHSPPARGAPWSRPLGCRNVSGIWRREELRPSASVPRTILSLARFGACKVGTSLQLGERQRRWNENKNNYVMFSSKKFSYSIHSIYYIKSSDTCMEH